MGEFREVFPLQLLRGAAQQARKGGVGGGKPPIQARQRHPEINPASRILGYLDGRLNESARLEVEKHLASCAPCSVRVNEFRAVSGLLDELPVIEPSPEFDVRVRARVAAEPVRRKAGGRG